MKKIFSIVLFLSLGLVACHKDKDAPIISITAPTAAATFTTGSSVKITGNVTDNSLHELSIKVTKASDGTELFSAAPEVHDLTTYDINETWTPSVTADTDVILTVIAEDHEENSTTKTVNFTIKK